MSLLHFRHVKRLFLFKYKKFYLETCIIICVIDFVFRFGPLVWRSSKERKKGNKAARNAKCNSGDSGIQIEVRKQNSSIL